MRALQATLGLLIVLSALAGCVAEDDGVSKATGTPSTTTTSGNATVAPSNTTASVPPVANLTADVPNGSVPLTVTFTVANDEPNATVTVWVLAFGDGNTTNGTDVPAQAAYTYSAAGTFTATLTLGSQAGDAQATLTVTVEDASAAAAPPSALEYSSGPVLGCFTEAGPDACGAWLLGPGAGDAFGLWIELEPGHVGMSFTTVSATGDSDGWFFAEPDGDPLAADINNGGGEAGGVVPPEAKWLLVFPWATPSDDVVVTFTPAA